MVGGGGERPQVVGLPLDDEEPDNRQQQEQADATDQFAAIGCRRCNDRTGKSHRGTLQERECAGAGQQHPFTPAVAQRPVTATCWRTLLQLRRFPKRERATGMEDAVAGEIGGVLPARRPQPIRSGAGSTADVDRRSGIVRRTDRPRPHLLSSVVVAATIESSPGSVRPPSPSRPVVVVSSPRMYPIWSSLSAAPRARTRPSAPMA